ncbi:MAG: hypothetical protein HYY17_07950 [Planctomycetes bacterium]|nr:hypothetical protein [Planctomycetota bacterium]
MHPLPADCLAIPSFAPRATEGRQDPGWKKENFAGPVPEGIARSKNGHIELVNILGSRRWRHAGAVESVAFSPDGKRALSGSDDATLKLWEVESGKEIATWKGHEKEVSSVAFSPDGKRALSGSEDNTLKLWEVESGKEIDSIVVDGRPTSLAVRACAAEATAPASRRRGDLVVVGNRNTTLTVYRLK